MKLSKSREKLSSEFGFSGNMTMVSYVPKKGKAVVLLSTMHDDRAVDDNSVKKKPEVIQYYNQTKSGVDTMDQMVRPTHASGEHGGHQTGGPSEEVQVLPSCQRPKSQQLVFKVHQPCVQGAQTLIVICESCMH
ncbi:hypothetical protein VZT92_026754 [Zoarces viviparus]